MSPQRCLASPEAFAAAPPAEIADAILVVAFADAAPAGWPSVNERDLDAAIQAVVPFEKSGWLSMSDDETTLRWVTREGVGELVRQGLALQSWDSGARFVVTLTRAGCARAADLRS